MVSTRLMDGWPDIPRGKLLTALRAKSRHVVRSDEKLPGEGKTFFRDPSNLFVEVQVPL
jgi:hypothetical protein